MTPSFVVAQPIQRTNPTPRTSYASRPRTPVCSLGTSNPSEASNLSATDRMYLAKVKARLMNSRHAAGAARGDVPGMGEMSGEARRIGDDDITIPDDLDAMEDVLFDRGPANTGQVQMFGAWLDEAVAGRKANDSSVTPNDVSDRLSDISVERNRPSEISKDSALEKADLAFTRAMMSFNRGLYTEATLLYAEAVTLVGAHSRLGGQYQLWQAQALDAAGRKSDASVILQNLEAHLDREVRKVARELLFILMAPRLQLDSDSFIEIPQIDDSSSHVTKGLLLSNFGPLRAAFVKKAPERHSLQWYLEKERPRKVADHSNMQAFVVMAAIVGTLAFMAVSPYS